MNISMLPILSINIQRGNLIMNDIHKIKKYIPEFQIQSLCDPYSVNSKEGDICPMHHKETMIVKLLTANYLVTWKLLTRIFV